MASGKQTGIETVSHVWWYLQAWHPTSVLTEVCLLWGLDKKHHNKLHVNPFSSSFYSCSDRVAATKSSHVSFVWGRVGKSDARVDGFYFQLAAKDVLESPQKGQTSQNLWQLHATAREQNKSKNLLLSTIFLIQGSFFLVPFVSCHSNCHELPREVMKKCSKPFVSSKIKHK